MSTLDINHVIKFQSVFVYFVLTVFEIFEIKTNEYRNKKRKCNEIDVLMCQHLAFTATLIYANQEKEQNLT